MVNENHASSLANSITLATASCYAAGKIAGGATCIKAPYAWMSYELIQQSSAYCLPPRICLLPFSFDFIFATLACLPTRRKSHGLERAWDELDWSGEPRMDTLLQVHDIKF